MGVRKVPVGDDGVAKIYVMGVVVIVPLFLILFYLRWF